VVKITNCNVISHFHIRDVAIYIGMNTNKDEKLRHGSLTAWIGELESSKADIIESLIVKDHTLISIFN